jgi:hypothetical protein
MPQGQRARNGRGSVGCKGCSKRTRKHWLHSGQLIITVHGGARAAADAEELAWPWPAAEDEATSAAAA